MLSIRLTRVGKKNAPSYRLIVIEKTRDPWAKALEILGNYNPRKEPPEITFDIERIKHWLSKGAEVSDTVWNLFVDLKLVEGKKHSVTHISKTRHEKLDKEKGDAKVAAEKKAADAAAKAEAEKAAKVAKAEADKQAAEAAKAAAEAAKVADAAKPVEKVEEKPAEAPKVEELKKEYI